MIRFLFRFLGLICLAAAFVLVVYDGTKSIAGNHLYFMSVQAFWQTLNAGSLQNFVQDTKPLLVPYAGGVLWDPGVLGVLAAPAWSFFGVFGILFLLLGRRKKPLIGYAR
ncbi:MAG TPA: hypothetical protein VE224_01345 [Pseudolabrys sp.]|nr:hypothetical protein [Pseudolabrys sp.]